MGSMKGQNEPENETLRRYRRPATVVLIGGIMLLAAYVFYPFLSAIFWAATFSVLMYPVYRWMRKRLSENVSAAFSVIATLGLIVLPICVFGFVIYAQLASAVKDLDLASAGDTQVTSAQVLQKVDETLHPVLENVGIDFHFKPWFEDNRQQIVRSLSGPLTRFAVTAGTTLLNFAVALVTMFFMLRDGHKLLKPVRDLSPLRQDETQGILDRIAATIRAVFVGVVLVSMVQGALCGVAYAFLGVPSPILWGIVTIVICMVPLLGAPFGYIPISLYLIFDGRWVNGVILLGIGLGIISNVDNFLRPMVMGNKTQLPYIAIFFGLLGGAFAFGAVGIVVGPVIIAIALSAIQIWRDRVTAQPAALETS